MKKQIFTLLAGMALGMALLSGGYAAANTVLSARPTTQTFYLNDERIDLTAYLIGGSNYVRLRDIGKAVDFGVTYDGTTNSVYIDPDTRYESEVTAPAPAQTAPLALTEENVRAAILALKEIYPNNSVYPAPYRSTSGGPYYSGMNCAGWATLCSDAAFGGLPWQRIDNPNWDQIRVGDLVEYGTKSGSHVIVVVEKTDEYLAFTDSGTTQKVYWGGQYPRWWLAEQSGLILYTRYPK